MRKWTVVGVLLGAALLGTSLPDTSLPGALLAGMGPLVGEASACGGFFSPRPNPERRPSLAYEQALIVHDAVKGREHFIREIAFRAGSETFGFVVPTPTLPEVAKVEKSPFSTLRERFPYEVPPPGGGGRGEGIGLGSAGGLGHGAGVSVLDVQKVGSFTAFVLAADDAGALAKWLKDNGLVSSPEADPWLAHYVKAKFYYVAMRYDPPQDKEKKPNDSNAKLAPQRTNKAEVVRISFDTPRAYYPYYEPEKPPGMAAGPRLVELWLATQGGTSQPIAVRSQQGKTEWLRPFGEGQRFDDAREGLVAALSSGDVKLLPEGKLGMQRFMDQKQRRTGWGDALFVPEVRDPRDPATDAALKKLAPILDPTLLPGDAR